GNVVRARDPRQDDEADVREVTSTRSSPSTGSAPAAAWLRLAGASANPPEQRGAPLRSLGSQRRCPRSPPGPWPAPPGPRGWPDRAEGHGPDRGSPPEACSD